MKFIKELEIKDTSCGNLPQYKPLVLMHINPSSPNNDFILLDANVNV
jgi:hypothetical protein